MGPWFCRTLQPYFKYKHFRWSDVFVPMGRFLFVLFLFLITDTLPYPPNVFNYFGSFTLSYIVFVQIFVCLCVCVCVHMHKCTFVWVPTRPKRLSFKPSWTGWAVGIPLMWGVGNRLWSSAEQQTSLSAEPSPLLQSQLSSPNTTEVMFLYWCMEAFDSYIKAGFFLHY